MSVKFNKRMIFAFCSKILFMSSFHFYRNSMWTTLRCGCWCSGFFCCAVCLCGWLVACLVRWPLFGCCLFACLFLSVVCLLYMYGVCLGFISLILVGDGGRRRGACLCNCALVFAWLFCLFLFFVCFVLVFHPLKVSSILTNHIPNQLKSRRTWTSFMLVSDNMFYLADASQR